MKKLLDNLEEYIMAVLICAMVILEAANAFLDVIGSPALGLPQELALYCYVWVAFLSIAFCTKHGCDVVVNMISSRYPGSIQAILPIITAVINLFVSVCLLIGAIGFMQSTIQAGSTGPLSGMPLVIVYASSVVGFILAIWRNIELLVTSVKNYQTVKEGK